MPTLSSVDSDMVRGHNEGSLYRRTITRKDGTVVPFLVAAVSLPDGRRITRWTKGDPEDKRIRRLAAKALEELQHERDAGRAPKTVSLGSFLARWSADVEGAVRPETARHYQLHVRGLIAGLGRVPIDSLSVPDVNAHIRALALSPQTRKHRRAVLRRALNDAMRQGLVRVNVAALSQAPKVERSRTHPLTLDQSRHLLTMKDRLMPLVRLALESGQRESELIAITWPDVDLAARTVVIGYALGREGGEIVRVEPKTEGSRHTIPITEPMAEALRSHRAKQHRERLATGNGGPYDGLVFTRPNGRPYYSKALLNEWYPLLERAGLPKVRFHDLRHSTATILLSLGWTLEDVKQLLGHSTITLTSDTYSHAVPSRLRSVVDGMAEALR